MQAQAISSLHNNPSQLFWPFFCRLFHYTTDPCNATPTHRHPQVPMYLSSIARSLSRGTRPSQLAVSPLLSAFKVPTSTTCQSRWSSHSPMGTPPANPRKKVTLPTLHEMHKK